MLIVLLLCLILSILYFLFQYVLIPYQKVYSYKKLGFLTEFFPIMGAFWTMVRDIKTKGDFQASQKVFSKKFPDHKIVVSNIGSKPLFILRSPEYLREYLQKPHLYKKHSFIQLLKPLLGNGLVTAEGEIWKSHRKIISSSFHYEFLKSHVDLIYETTKEFMDKITPRDYENFRVMHKLEEITGEIVGRIFFGKKLNSHSIQGKPITFELAEIVTELALCMRTPLAMIFGLKALNSSFIPRYKKIMARVVAFRSTIMSIIQDRKANPQPHKDLLSSLLATQDPKNPDQGFSEEDIIDEYITFFLAGMDTTGHLSTMTLYNLTVYPQYLKDLKEERKRTYESGDKLTIESLQSMNILHALLKETLRFYTPTPELLVRTAQEDHKILDLQVKEGDAILPDFMSVFFNGKYFENPDQFDPARWTTAENKLDPYAFTPFSAGPRNCIGQHLAIIEAKIILSEFLKRFEFKLKEGYKLSMTIRFLYEPSDEILFDLSSIKSKDA